MFHSYLSVVMEIVEIHRRFWTGAHKQEIVVLQLGLRQVRLAGASMELWQCSQDVLQHVQKQTEKRALTIVELNTVFDTSLQRLGTIGPNFRRLRSQQATSHHEQNLILVVDVRVRQLFGQQLIKNDAEGINVRLERVRILLVHPDHLRCHPQNRPCWLVLPS